MLTVIEAKMEDVSDGPEGYLEYAIEVVAILRVRLQFICMLTCRLQKNILQQLGATDRTSSDNILPLLPLFYLSSHFVFAIFMILIWTCTRYIWIIHIMVFNRTISNLSPLRTMFFNSLSLWYILPCSLIVYLSDTFYRVL